VDRFYRLDPLIVPIGARVKIGPGNRAREGIIPHRGSGWIHVPGVEMMGRSNVSQAADRRTQIHVVPCEEHASAPGTKRGYSGAVFGSQAIPHIYGEEPQLSIVASIKIGEQRIGRAQRIAVSSRHIEKQLS
jgi:hypothetical protein